MKMTQVSSSNIESLGYNPDDRKLHVQFLNGNLYEYAEVPKELFELMMASTSKGSFFHKEIKGNYPAKQI